MELDEIARAVWPIVPAGELGRTHSLIEDGEDLISVDSRGTLCPPSLVGVACGLKPAGTTRLRSGEEVRRALPVYSRLCGALGVSHEVLRPADDFAAIAPRLPRGAREGVLRRMQRQLRVVFARDPETLGETVRALRMGSGPERDGGPRQALRLPECCVEERVRREKIRVRVKSDPWWEVRRYVWHSPCRAGCPETEALARKVEEIVGMIYLA